ncbi:hypothetical protein AWZ03_000764 [Drosophila navojoa]|uniref:Uncharacterized protein n=1 Tax=Drosophila navojoa TaxID=7232 RepID=A0A484BXP2_DRONA|nr:hypothetical protein AWZ03_000764 [Drosophila navojoa]
MRQSNNNDRAATHKYRHRHRHWHWHRDKYEQSRAEQSIEFHSTRAAERLCRIPQESVEHWTSSLAVACGVLCGRVKPLKNQPPSP